MAELGIVASAFQIADLGVRLSLRLYTFGETVAGADKSIISISKDVSLTSTVLKELGQTLERDQTARICSPNAVQTAESIAKECQRIFQDMDQALVKKFANIKSAEKDRRVKAAQTLERLRWPFIKGKIELMTSNLERQKSTLLLMLNVITLAKQEYERYGEYTAETEPYTMIAEQRSLIQDLARSNEEYTRKFERLKVSCESVPVPPEPILADCNNTMPTSNVPIARGLASASAMVAACQGESSTGAQGLGPDPYMGSWYLHGSDTSLPDQFSWLQQQYRKLMRTLLIEVSAPSYAIADDSRSRIKAEIVTIHIREMEHMEQIQYSRPASLARPMAAPIAQMQMQRQIPNYRNPIPTQQAQARAYQHSYNNPMPVLRDYYESYGIPNSISQDATSNSHSEMAIGAPSHSTRGEHEQTSAAQTRPSMTPMTGASPPPGGYSLHSFQQAQSAKVPPVTTPDFLLVTNRANSSGDDPRATILHGGQRQSLSKPQPGIAIPSPYETSQSLSTPQPYALLMSAKAFSSNAGSAEAVDQESSMYGKSAGESDQRRPELHTLGSQAHASSSATRKRKVPGSAENKSSSPRRYKHARRHKDLTAVAEDTKTPKVGASDEMHLATSYQDPGNKKASEDNAVYAQDETSLHLLGERSPRRTFENHTPEDWAENVVDKLLAAWTTLPLSANRTASQPGGFAVVAH